MYLVGHTQSIISDNMQETNQCFPVRQYLETRLKNPPMWKRHGFFESIFIFCFFQKTHWKSKATWQEPRLLITSLYRRTILYSGAKVFCRVKKYTTHHERKEWLLTDSQSKCCHKKHSQSDVLSTRKFINLGLYTPDF